MVSLTQSPSIDQAALLQLDDNFHELAQQTKSRLVNSGVIKHVASDGKTHEMARIGRIELTEVSTRNPDKSYGDYSVDNRKFTKRRFTKTVQIDAKQDINELIKDPTSDILNQLHNAKERVIDRIAVAAAVGDVLVGAPDAAPTSVDAATDGVLTVDATAGLTYQKVQEVTENFINNDLDFSDFQGSTFAISGAENTALMNELEFISSDYISSRPVAEGKMSEAGTYRIVMFAGSKTGGITVPNPILPESAGVRSNVVLTRESIVMSMELASVDVSKSDKKVNSWDITIDF